MAMKLPKESIFDKNWLLCSGDAGALEIFGEGAGPRAASGSVPSKLGLLNPTICGVKMALRTPVSRICGAPCGLFTFTPKQIPASSKHFPRLLFRLHFHVHRLPLRQSTTPTKSRLSSPLLPLTLYYIL